MLKCVVRKTRRNGIGIKYEGRKPMKIENLERKAK
jgi:hypothetical protein